MRESKCCRTGAMHSAIWLCISMASQAVGVAAPAAVPSPPSNLTATAVSPVRVDLVWSTGSADEAGFKIQRQIKGQPAFSEIASVGAGAKAYRDAAATAGKKCSYRVAAYNNDCTSAFSNTATAKTPAEKKAPKAPSGLAASLGVSGSVTLTWQDNSTNERGFMIQRSFAGGSLSTIATLDPNSSSYIDDSPAGGAQNTYQVSSFNIAGASPSNQVSVQVPSRIFSFTLTPATPGPFTADGASGTEVTIRVADDKGNPVPGLHLDAALYLKGDIQKPIAVTETGGGSY